MFLMNVPPVAVTPHTEWRTCGTPGGYSLPLCLNDSDSDLSTRGTPISDKVQMIIESLRSTQSTEMGDENERKGLSGQEGHPQVYAVAMGSFVGANSKAQQISPSICNNSHDSDSDDSVDRGIEEAILEYLKEKDGPKPKVETCPDDSQPSKIPRSPSPIPGISQPNSGSCAFLTTNKELPENVIVAKSITPTTYPIKKYIKHKASITESSSTKQESSKPPSKMNDLPISQTNQPSTYLSGLIKLRKHPDEDTDSSSDDGIEEAIQKYQIEKNQQYKTETQKLHTLSEDSDSTSDDGIEEAIRHYQLEQLKKKSILKPFLNKEKTPVSKCTTKGHHVPSTGTIKKRKLRKKRNKMKKEVLSVSIPGNTLLDCTKGNVLHSFKVERFKGPATPPKTNTTTVELMCAEAILDISKTVMPGAFQQSPSRSNASSVGTCALSSLPDIKLEDESDDSSIDSEDGIEQEIRIFLEHKAQMQKQTLGSAAAPEPSKNESEAVKTTDAEKPGRLSLTKKRKHKAEKLMSALSNVKDTMCVADSNDESTPPASPTSKLEKKEQSGDKSSSLDSDEDLDLAIKDLLKTKKKLKKKTRDLKRKPEKCIKKELQGSVSLSKKAKLDHLKQSCLKQSGKANYELSYSTLPKDDISQKLCNTSQEYVIKEESESYKCSDLTVSTQTEAIKDEDSSVDSDDSIELEIRKFLAEKAKVATAEHIKPKTVSTNGVSPMCAEIQAEDVQQENQLAEIPSKNILLPRQSAENRPLTENKRPEKKQLFLSSQHLTLRNSLAAAQSHSPSSPTCSQSLLEPADGAGAATDAPRTPKLCSGNIQGTSQPKEGQSVLNSNLTASQSASIKWRQSLGLPITDTKIRTPFQVTSSKMNETTLTKRPYQSVQNFKVQNPVWSSAKAITASFPRNTEAGFHPHALSLLSPARQHPGPFTQALASGRSSQFTIEGETKSMVHISKDKSVYVELETNRTNHVQVRSKDRSEGKQCQDLQTANNSERKSGKMEEKVCPNLKEENFIDEADYESGNQSNQEKKQGLSTLSLSSAIDPGFTFKPCIALTSDERSERFSRRCMDNTYTKEMVSWRSGNLQQSVQHVKRKLQFVPVQRKNDATSLQI
ncbi:protein phosphatase 1 regulatory subunit 26 [Eucyclogobius newberryi]|uniref:protein phosphatase 1 regulatory subunit 26 n=1 Tax=Eucyclogobius newberryi TaxID=166745 RepID=UPI003B5AD941